MLFILLLAAVHLFPLSAETEITCQSVVPRFNFGVVSDCFQSDSTFKSFLMIVNISEWRDFHSKLKIPTNFQKKVRHADEGQRKRLNPYELKNPKKKGKKEKKDFGKVGTKICEI
jgi:hypothetical protein